MAGAKATVTCCPAARLEPLTGKRKVPGLPSTAVGAPTVKVAVAASVTVIAPAPTLEMSSVGDSPKNTSTYAPPVPSLSCSGSNNGIDLPAESSKLSVPPMNVSCARSGGRSVPVVK